MGKSNQAMPFVLFLLGILATVGMVISFFLPYSTATESRREVLEEYADEVVDEDLDMTGEDIEEISLSEYGHIFIKASGEDTRMSEDGKIFWGIFAVEGVFLVLTAVFLLTKKYIPMLIFSLLLFGTNLLMGWLFKIGGYVPGEYYNYGIGRAISLVFAVVLVICAIWLLVLKCIANRKSRRNLTPPAPVETTAPVEAVEN